jgi:hypothetical protein
MTPAEPPSDDTDPDQRIAVAAYIAELTTDLTVLAQSHGLTVLSQILDMARLEAESVAHRRGMA